MAFVATACNIRELRQVVALGRLGAPLFSVSNVLPYTAGMQADALYSGAPRNLAYLAALHLPRLALPQMDINAATGEAFNAALNSGCSVTFAGSWLGGVNDVCNFIEGGTLSVAWDGSVSPCWPLMHDHTSDLHGKPRRHVPAAPVSAYSRRSCPTRLSCLSPVGAELRAVHILRRVRAGRG